MRLRAHEPEDLDAVMGWVNDPSYREHIQLRYPMAKASEAAWVGQGSPTYQRTSFAIETRDDRRLIGAVDLRTGAPEERVAELGIAIGPAECRGKGFGTDATIAACSFGFDEMDLARISLWVHADNDAGRRCYEKVGFVHEGVARQATYRHGRRIDLHLYGLLPGELRRA